MNQVENQLMCSFNSIISFDEIIDEIMGIGCNIEQQTRSLHPESEVQSNSQKLYIHYDSGTRQTMTDRSLFDHQQNYSNNGYTIVTGAASHRTRDGERETPRQDQRGFGAEQAQIEITDSSDDERIIQQID